MLQWNCPSKAYNRTHKAGNRRLWRAAGGRGGGDQHQTGGGGTGALENISHEFYMNLLSGRDPKGMYLPTQYAS